MGVLLGRLPEERKQPMRELVGRWKRTGAAVSVLEESLITLSALKRASAQQLLETNGSPVAAIACTYGRGSRAKLALPKEDAKLLLALVHEISSCKQDEPTKLRMMDKAVSVLLGGQAPATLSDPKWKPLLDILGGFDPAIKQGSLF
ncbi:MAG TPA: hypothetical protein VLD37_02490 [Candidatus Bilamarchaeum sp.]|nr:hypothetical protein [Candidatus Bilamarchaeum sp.]